MASDTHVLFLHACPVGWVRGGGGVGTDPPPVMLIVGG